ncbi:DNA-binding SARP family transcriptional activator [Allocatelliglobosispora scoriae]|uniref:DNA-binding SARP family transcriptional activator n=1 Tax=Allocatelliglobosispora scoriae TaxID=643052 RepID=A0A841BZ45_9ACTN|nr:AfsR/SARP family transcriptional regulator [Allocatelliglobosispora scoriae]MBB5872856.1 DNA-binding SARP family transcriptional activator [Allocatelliglobosispora scoriae]
MEYCVLGRLAVRSGPVVGRLTAPKPRKVLALLLVRANLLVPIETLSLELWGDEPPASAQTIIQTYVLQIRRMLAQASGLDSADVARDVLVTASSGYRLQAQPGELDLHDYERLVGAARSALADGSLDDGSRLLSGALELWQDTALADIKLGPVLKVEVSRLEEDRLAACQQRIDAELRLDRHHAVLGELGSLAVRHPLNEDLQAQFMIALYRAGRRNEALEAFHRLRTTLLDDIGLEPSQRIHRLQHAILTADPSLDVVLCPTFADELAVTL